MGGRWNRAQRSSMNYLESLPSSLANAVLAGFVFPVPVFILVAVAGLGSIKYAIRYTKTNSDRQAGMFVSKLALAIVEGLVITTGIASLLRAQQTPWPLWRDSSS